LRVPPLPARPSFRESVETFRPSIFARNAKFDKIEKPFGGAKLTDEEN